jgi:hypothetical protein
MDHAGGSERSRWVDLVADRVTQSSGRWGNVRAMYRLVLVAAAAQAACSQTDNNRPATLEYITEAILQPACSQAVCHSSFRMERGLAFDTVDVARRSLRGIVSMESESSLLYNVLIRKVKRMPYDAPLPDKDIALIKQWIDDGAPGLETP